jgi:cell division protein FtsB
MTKAPEIKLFTLAEWLIITAVLLGIVGYFAYPSVYKKVQTAVSEDLQTQLKTANKTLADTEEMLAKAKSEIEKLKSTPVLPFDNPDGELANTKTELADTKDTLAKAEVEVKRLEDIIKKNPDENPDDKLQKKVWDWEDYAKKASAYQDYLEHKPEAPKVERPSFPYTLL